MSHSMSKCSLFINISLSLTDHPNLVGSSILHMHSNKCTRYNKYNFNNNNKRLLCNGTKYCIHLIYEPVFILQLFNTSIQEKCLHWYNNIPHKNLHLIAQMLVNPISKGKIFVMLCNSSFY